MSASLAPVQPVLPKLRRIRKPKSIEATLFCSAEFRAEIIRSAHRKAKGRWYQPRLF